MIAISGEVIDTAEVLGFGLLGVLIAVMILLVKNLGKGLKQKERTGEEKDEPKE